MRGEEAIGFPEVFCVDVLSRFDADFLSFLHIIRFVVVAGGGGGLFDLFGLFGFDFAGVASFGDGAWGLWWARWRASVSGE